MNQKGFTLIEVLIVIGMLAILAAIVIVAINPGRQFAQARNTQRVSNVNTILNAVYQYASDNNGNLPARITTSELEICATNYTTSTCDGASPAVACLRVLTDDEKYLVALPADPSCPTGCNTNGTGYKILKSATGRLTVTAPNAELGEVISVSR